MTLPCQILPKPWTPNHQPFRTSDSVASHPLSNRHLRTSSREGIEQPARPATRGSEFTKACPSRCISKPLPRIRLDRTYRIKGGGFRLVQCQTQCGEVRNAMYVLVTSTRPRRWRWTLASQNDRASKTSDPPNQPLSARHRGHHTTSRAGTASRSSSSSLS